MVERLVLEVLSRRGLWLRLFSTFYAFYGWRIDRVIFNASLKVARVWGLYDKVLL
jgi:hypothetical protein